MKAAGLATWQGTWKDGSGTISTTSPTLRSEPYTFSSRFAPGTPETPGASPEELLAAAHAGCFNQALANNFGMIGFEADHVDTSVTVELGQGTDGHPAIIGVLVVCTAKVPRISRQEFDYCAERARTHCTIAKLMRFDAQMSATLLT